MADTLTRFTRPRRTTLNLKNRAARGSDRTEWLNAFSRQVRDQERIRFQVVFDDLLCRVLSVLETTESLLD